MTTAPNVALTQREPELLGQTVVVIGGSSGIGLETARRARAEGADVVLTGRDPDRLKRAAAELNALSSAAFDATDPAALDRFFQGLPEQIGHVMVTAGGPYYARAPAWRSKWRQSGSTSSPPALSTRRCPANCLAPTSKRAALSSAPHCPSGAWSSRPMSLHSPCT